MDTFLASYIETALWSSTDGDDIGTPLDDSKFADCEMAEKTITAMQKDCDVFQAQAEALFEAYRNLPDNDGTAANYTQRRELIAHDFWLTRNHHGAGFWDGDYPEPLGLQLTDLAHSFSECDLYVGDDGKFYL